MQNLEPTDGPGFQELARRLAESPPLAGIVYLWGLDTVADPLNPNEPAFDDTLRQAGAGLLHLVQALAAHPPPGSPRLTVITRGVQANEAMDSGEDRPAGGRSEDGDAAAIRGLAQGMLWGLARTLSWEQPDLRCRLVDLDPEPGKDELANDSLIDDRTASDRLAPLLAELTTDDREDQVALRHHQRWLPRLRPYIPKATAEASDGSDPTAADAVTIRADKTYLITGGLGDLGQRFARWLVERGARHLILLSRSTPSATAQQTMAALEALGARVRLAQGDVSDRAALAAALAATEPGSAHDSVDGTPEPPLGGVIHAAGLLRDRTLPRLTWNDFEQVLAAKAGGAWNLHQLTRHHSLDFLVFFSSAASLLGSPGQANYAAANAVLDTLATFRRRQGMAATSLQWGPWGEIGMATRGAAGRASGQGLGRLRPRDGVAAFERLLGVAPSQVAVLRVEPQGLAPGRVLPPMLDVLARQHAAVGDDRLARFADQLRAAPSETRERLIARMVRQQVVAVLALEADAELRDAQVLQELGLDSLMAVELHQRLTTATGEELPVTLLFDYPNIRAVSQYLHQRLFDDTEASPENAAGATLKTQSSTLFDSTHSIELPASLEELETLSAHDVDHLYSTLFETTPEV